MTTSATPPEHPIARPLEFPDYYGDPFRHSESPLALGAYPLINQRVIVTKGRHSPELELQAMFASMQLLRTQGM